MGRLDNAMRRAAEQRAERTSVATIDGQDGQNGRDPYVDEFPSTDVTPDSPTVSAESAVVAPVSAPVPAAPATSDGQPARAGEKEPSLFRHIDARFATKTVVDESMMPVSREQYRRLAAALHQAQRTNGCKVVMVASAAVGEGKTLTAANLALTLSESYRRNVLVVDGDLRRPSMHTLFQIDGAPGLSDGLTGNQDDPKLPLHRLSPRLTILPAGKPMSDPIRALTADRMRRLIEEAREVFDWVIIDTPPVGLLTDASLVSSMADGVVLVVRAESTPFDMVNRAVQSIGRERIMGVILNRAQEMPVRSDYDQYKYYYGGSPLATGRE